MPSVQGKKHLWQIDWDFGRLIALKKANIVNLLDPKPDEYTRFLTDIEVIGQCLFVLCETQIKEHGLDESTFAADFGGNAFSQAITAMTEGLVDFFQSLHRTEMVAMIKNMQTSFDRGMNQQKDLIESPELEQAVNDELAKQKKEALSKLSGNGLGSSA